MHLKAVLTQNIRTRAMQTAARDGNQQRTEFYLVEGVIIAADQPANDRIHT